MTSSTGTTRVIALVDMDCFYVQVEERDDPSIKGKPAAVVQYKTYKGGGIIAVNYEARAKGVTRNMRGDDAKVACPEVILVRVPETRGKADLTKYRDAGREVIQVLSEFSSCVERASIDEAYIDLSSAVEEKLNGISESQDMFSTLESKDYVKSLKMEHFGTNFVMGYEDTKGWLDMIEGSEMCPMDDVKLAIGAQIVGEMREAVYQKTGFRCSAGIAHNKVLAKLACGINKPNKQTVLPHSSVPELWAKTKLKKVRNLGGKLGDYFVEKLECEFMSDLKRFTEKELSTHVGSKTGSWIYQLAQGLDDEPVNPRQLPKSIGCNKNFFGPEALTTKEKVKFWINQLSAEVTERIQKDFEVNNRKAKTLTLHVLFGDQNALSRSCRLNPQYNQERIAADAFSMMDKLYQTLGVLPIHSLGLIASKFEDEMDTTGYAKISSFFTAGVQKPSTSSAASATSTSIMERGSESTGSSNSSEEKESPPIMPFPSENLLIKKSVNPFSDSKSKEAETMKKDDKDDQPPRKQFFVFSSGVPTTSAKASVSPLKSPRKPLPTTSRGEEGENVSPSKLPVAMRQDCERCGKSLPLWEYVAHMDHHFAKDLSRELNGLPPLGFDLRPETLERIEREQETSPTKRTSGAKRLRGRGGSNNQSTGSKRGRPASKPSASSSATRPSKTLDCYFKKPS